MIIFTTGNILKSNAEAIVNTVNTVGVMGKGLALQFKKLFPDMYKQYSSLCKDNKIKIGEIWPYKNNSLLEQKYIINFPTKKHWKEKSSIDYIYYGLHSLVEFLVNNNVKSVAIPPLGCGNGGLPWGMVKQIMLEVLSVLDNVHITIYEPTKDIDYLPPNPSKKPKLTNFKASILDLIFQFRELGYNSTWLVIQKLAYFLQESGENLKLKFEKCEFGPYADNLRHVFMNMEGYYTTGLYDGNNVRIYTNIIPIESEYDNIKSVVIKNTNHRNYLEKVKNTIYGYESPYGLELLSTIHWSIKYDGVKSNDLNGIIFNIQKWNERKAKMMKKEHIIKAYNRLVSEKWF